MALALGISAAANAPVEDTHFGIFRIESITGYEHLRIGHGDAVATVALARPDARNALNAGLIAEIRRCMEELAEDDNVRVVILTGEGDFFCAGADIGYMKDMANFSY